MSVLVRGNNGVLAVGTVEGLRRAGMVLGEGV